MKRIGRYLIAGVGLMSLSAPGLFAGDRDFYRHEERRREIRRDERREREIRRYERERFDRRYWR